MAAEFKPVEAESTSTIVYEGPNSDHYIWKIDNKNTIHNILNSNNGQLFDSQIFSMCKLNWMIRLYPNGNQVINTGSVKIFLKLLSLPLEFDKIMLSFSIVCDKGMSCHSDMRIYDKSGQGSGWLDHTQTLHEWRAMNITNLSILITIKIHFIALKPMISNDSILSRFIPEPYHTQHNDIQNKSVVKYVITVQMMHAFKWSVNGKRFESEIFDGMWRLQCYPNGNTYGKDCNGFISMYLRCVFMPPLVTKIKAKFSIVCKETGNVLRTQNEFTYQTKDLGSGKFMQLSTISQLKSLTFIAYIEVLDVVRAQPNAEDHIFYNPSQMEEILASVADAKHVEGAERVMLHDLETFKPEYINNGEMDKLVRVVKDDEKIDYHEKLEALSVNVQENREMMEKIQTEIQRMNQQINALRLVVLEPKLEENKLDELEKIKQDIESIKCSIDKGVRVQLINTKEQSVMEEWMRTIVKLPQYIELFIENGLDDLMVIRHITMNELTMIGIHKIGHKIKIIKAIEQLKVSNNQGHHEGKQMFN